MHRDAIHNAFTHYGIRTPRYKLICWYNDPLDQIGATRGDEPPGWELFDCEADPFELHNCANDPSYAQIFLDMLGILDAKMAEIGDMPERDSHAVRQTLT
jgi:arylsulfatase A-like enzyme